MSSVRVAPSNSSNFLVKNNGSSPRVTLTARSPVSQPNVIRSPSSPFIYVAHGDFSIVWTNVAVFVIGHICWAYALYLVITLQVQWMTFGYCFWLTNWAGIGIGSGAHRLWAHRSYQAEWSLKMFLMIGQLIAGQNCLFIWCRDHRVHHKYSDSDADPHNSKRGYFFAHVGWLLRKKHPDVKSKFQSIDLSDLKSDPIVQLQSNHYWILYFFVSFALPIVVPVYFWNETWINSLFISYFLRYMTSLHCTWFVNSTAHMFGDRPYNLSIRPVENSFVSLCTFGEGYHNYHHTFPMDYATSELPYILNVSKVFIEICNWAGLAKNLRRPSDALIAERKRKVLREQMILQRRNRQMSTSSIKSLLDGQGAHVDHTGYDGDGESEDEIIYDSKSL